MRAPYRRLPFLPGAGFLMLMLPPAAIPQVAFEEVTAPAGLTHTGPSYGASWGDMNGDGHPDLWVNNHGDPPGIYLNQGDGTFINVTATVWPGPSGDTHGVAWADFDNDGDEDVIEVVGGAARNHLYINEGTHFVERATQYGVAQPGARSRTPVWFDWNGDGLLDLILTQEPAAGVTRPIILTNNGHTFEDATNATGIRNLNSNVAFLADFTENGRLDVLFSNGSHNAGPLYSTATRPFAPVDRRIFPALPAQLGCFDSTAADFNNDLRVDLVSTCAGGQRQVKACGSGCLQAMMVVTGTEHALEFTSSGRLTVTLLPYDHFKAQEGLRVGSGGHVPPTTATNDVPGLSFSVELDPANSLVWGQPTAAGEPAGVYIGFDRSSQRWRLRLSSEASRTFGFIIRSAGTISNVTTHGFSANPPAWPPLYLVRTLGGLVNRAPAMGLGMTLSCPSVVSGDFDNDMDMDLYFVCSQALGNLPNRLFLNDGVGRFTEVSGAAGAAGSLQGVGDTATTVDYDGDGFLDIFVTNGRGGAPFNRGPNQLFRNKGNANNWLAVELTGTLSNRSAIGSIVTIRAGGVEQQRILDGGMHTRSQNHKRLHFGLGPNGRVDSLEVRWPSGHIERFTSIRGNRVLKLIENDNPDSDGDGRIDVLDNCIHVPNPDQRDTDGDGIGNMCDGDFNNDGVVNLKDMAFLYSQRGTSHPHTDLNGDGRVDNADMTIFRGLRDRAVGPSGEM